MTKKKTKKKSPKIKSNKVENFPQELCRTKHIWRPLWMTKQNFTQSVWFPQTYCSHLQKFSESGCPSHLMYITTSVLDWTLISLSSKQCSYLFLPVTKRSISMKPFQLKISTRNHALFRQSEFKPSTCQVTESFSIYKESPHLSSLHLQHQSWQIKGTLF